MDADKRARLEAAGFVFGDAEDFLGLTEDEINSLDFLVAEYGEDAKAIGIKYPDEIDAIIRAKSDDKTDRWTSPETAGFILGHYGKSQGCDHKARVREAAERMAKVHCQTLKRLFG